MIDVTPYQHCVCRKQANTQALCEAELVFSEQGKKVKLGLKPHENGLALVLDGCVFRDNQLKCDGLFLWCSPSKKAALLIELKGAGDIPHAFAQLAFVQKTRPEYRSLVERLRLVGKGKVAEKAFIISNGQLSKPDREKLEDQYNIRVTAVLHSEATKAIPDVRQYL